MHIHNDWFPDGALKGRYDLDDLKLPDGRYAHTLRLEELYSELKGQGLSVKPAMGKAELQIVLARHLHAGKIGGVVVAPNQTPVKP